MLMDLGSELRAADAISWGGYRVQTEINLSDTSESTNRESDMDAFCPYAAAC